MHLKMLSAKMVAILFQPHFDNPAGFLCEEKSYIMLGGA